MAHRTPDTAGRPMSRLKCAATSLGVAAFWIAVWAVAAYAVGNSLLLPSPAETVARLAELALTGEFWQCTAVSLLRVSIGIVTAVAAGVLTAALCCCSRVLDRLVFPFMTVIKSTPVASFIILALVWLGTSPLPAFISFLMVYPLIFTNVRAGVRSVAPSVLKMAKVFCLSPFTMVKRIYAPAAYGHFVTSVKASLGLAWKAGIAAEVLAAPKYSIGKMLFQSKVYFETTDLFAWTLVIIILSLLIELVVGRLLDHAAARQMHHDRGGEKKDEA